MITAVGVVVPARNERDTIVASVHSIQIALRRLPSAVERAVCVVADRCSDDTAERAARRIVTVVCNHRAATVGEVRAIGMRQVRRMLGHHTAGRTWLLSTDADTEVPPDWAVRHVEYAESGAHAVAGEAVLADRPRMPIDVARRYSALVAGARGPDGHGNVYGANLGVRADVYERVGGFGSVATGEDHDLWRRLREAGYRCEYADGLGVVTSARRRGRAPGGLAALLATLDETGPIPSRPR
jgi:cellulose synthase/poly-beta-1,6-N-acetylglucosamine synthase-like glycosyltransferase